MSDEQNNPAPPAPAPAAPATPEQPKEPMFSAADVAKILEAERGAVPAPVNDDPVARFRAIATKTATPKPAAAAQPDKLGQLVDLMSLQLMQAMAPKPPAPPKAMSLDEKLNSTDPNIWLGRDPQNSFSAADKQALIARHRSELIKAGFSGFVDREAEARANRELSEAFTKNLGSMKVTVR